MAASSRTELDPFFYDSERRQLRKIHQTELDHLEVLLKQGLDPNSELSDSCRYYERYCLLHIAIELGNLEFVRLLIKFHVNVNLPFFRGGVKRITNFPLYSPIEMFTLALKNQATALQAAIRKLNTSFDVPETLEKICEVIDESFIIPREYNVDFNDITSIYRKFHRIIAEGLFVAKNKKKPLLLLLGENHESHVSLFIEALAILIGKEFGINLLLCEFNKKMLSDFENKLFPSFPWKTFFATLPLAKQYGYSLQPIDLGRDKAIKNGNGYDDYEEKLSWDSSVDNTTRELMDYRDSVMHRVITNSVNQHSLAILGSCHLLGLHKQKFKNHHAVFVKTYDLIPTDTPSPTEKFYLSDRVVKLNQTSLDLMNTFWYPAKVIKHAEKVHTENKNVSLSQITSPRQNFFRCCKKSSPTSKQLSQSGLVHELKEGYDLIVKDIGFFPLAVSICREMATRVSLRFKK